MRHAPPVGHSSRLLLVLTTAATLLGLASCSTLRVPTQPHENPDTRIATPYSETEGSLVRLQARVRPTMDQHIAAEYVATLQALTRAESHSSNFKQPLAINALTRPWEGMIRLERYASELARISQDSGGNVSGLLHLIARDAFAPEEPLVSILSHRESHHENYLSDIISTLQDANHFREQSFLKLSPDDRVFLFDYARSLTDTFSPQIGQRSNDPLKQASDGLRFARLVKEYVDFAYLVKSAAILSQLSDPAWLAGIKAAFDNYHEESSSHPSVTGEVKIIRKTPFGFVVIGGAGQNTYELRGDIAVVIDLGGDDVYRGAIASPAKAADGNRVVIDLSGDDQYHGTALGTATGRLSVGLLFDGGGHDEYRLPPGSGGTGFAGVGLLIDDAGNDHYWGSKLTQGAALGGIGLLIDNAGHDTFTSFGYAIGFGGPLGRGIVIDASGDDSYQCGDVYSSGYNATDAPKSRPGDPLFQYTGFCLGVGSGTRIRTGNTKDRRYGLAGGAGFLLDLNGNDRYQSANFSQGIGYFFGAGVKLDLAGNDTHNAARYGHGAAAHYGIGLFIDAEGDDVYRSTGPHYNGGTAWDQSVAFSIDAGLGNDTYDLSHSTGLGRADHNSFSLFIDEDGNDLYNIHHGLGTTTKNSTSGFFNLGGCDDYGNKLARYESKAGKGETIVRRAGALFIDQGNCGKEGREPSNPVSKE